MMLDKIKLAVAAIVAAVVAGLSIALKLSKQGTKVAEANAAKYKAATETSEKTVEVLKNEAEVKTNVSKLSDDAVANILSKYDRSRED